MHNAPSSALLSQLHDAVLDVVAFINRPDRDETLIREAQIKLDRALSPLLVLTERLGPISVVELAGRVGRDHSTISRQIAKLVQLGLIERQPSPTDGRQRKLRSTASGRTMARQIDKARERLARRALSDWSEREIADLAQSLRRYADALATAERRRKGQGALRTAGCCRRRLKIKNTSARSFRCLRRWAAHRIGLSIERCTTVKYHS